MAENLLEMVLKKCRSEGCHFKASTGDRAAMEKHQEDWHRLVPCARCDDMIGMEQLGDHLVNAHGLSQLAYAGLSIKTGYRIYKDGSTSQRIGAVEGDNKSPKFVWNWAPLGKGAKVFWLAYLGPKDEAKTYKYTLQILESVDEEDYLLDCTRRCEPCDVSHQEMKRDMCGIVLDKKLIEQAAEGDNCVHFNVIIQKV